MKKILLITAIAASFATTSVNADTTAVLKVTGQLVVGGCTPELSGGGVVDYGTIRLATLSATDVNQLGTKDVSLSISCPSATKAAWTITDDRADTHPGASALTRGTALRYSAPASAEFRADGAGLQPESDEHVHA